MTETMQRWTMNAVGREHLQLTESAIPQPGPHQVRIKSERRGAELPR